LDSARLYPFVAVIGGNNPAHELVAHDISFIETNALAKEQEEELLYRNMQTDVVQQILLRLARLRPAGD